MWRYKGVSCELWAASMLIACVLLTVGFVLSLYWLFLIHVVLRTLTGQLLISGISVVASVQI